MASAWVLEARRMLGTGTDDDRSGQRMTSGLLQDEESNAESSKMAAVNAASAQLLFAKAAYVHPTAYTRDNLRGFVAIVSRDDGRAFLAFVPESLLAEDSEQYLMVEARQDGLADAVPLAEKVAVHIRAPARESHDYAFSIPLRTIYSLIVHKPTIIRPHGSITATQAGTALPTLYFHDDEAPIKHTSDEAVASWGGAALMAQLHRRVDVVQSSIEPSLYLVNPSRADLEAHALPIFDAAEVLPPKMREESRLSRNSGRKSILHEALAPDTRRDEATGMSNSTFSVLSAFSKITRNAQTAAKRVAQPILSHRLARPILPHLPTPVAHLAQAKPEWVSFEEEAGLEGFSPARVYLAKWARIVSEEGERARRQEIGAGDDGEEASALGAFELLASTYSIIRPRSTRAVAQRIVESEFEAWFDADGKLLLTSDEARKRIFQRGLTPATRRLAWPFLLGVFEWCSTASERKQRLRELTNEYEAVKSKWRDEPDVYTSEAFIEEHHRVEIDCRRTDRTHAMFAAEVPEDQDNETSGRRAGIDGRTLSNPHVRQMQHILLTYNTYENDSYCQGMSDLCSPLYVSLDGDESLVFWCFRAFMQRMKGNFLRDQSGMRDQLSLLQKLISLMDPLLYRHLEKTDSLNLFFAFRWILVGFKREFPLEQTCLIWETLWTDYLGQHLHIFFALAILEQQRDIIIRYCLTFDEVLKYINELSMTLEADPLLCQTEIGALSFKAIVDMSDRRKAEFDDGNQHDVSGLRARRSAADPMMPRAPGLDVDVDLRILLSAVTSSGAVL